MLTRRHLLAATLLPGLAGAAALTDVLVRPAPPVLSGKPSMVRIVRAGARLVAVGERGIVLLSDDDGQRWRQARVPISASLTGVQFIDERQGWAIGHGTCVLHTVDGGETWALQLEGSKLPEGLANPLLALHFSDAQHGWAVGAYGTALHTGDGGVSWQPRGDSLPNPKGLHLYGIARHGDTLFFAGEQGLLMSLSGDVATALPTPYRGSYFALEALPDGALLLCGLRGTALLRSPAGEYRTLDSGTTQAVVSANALGPNRWALVDQSGRVFIGDATAGRFVPQPAEAQRRWVAVALARDGALVGAGGSGVARLPASSTSAQ